MDEIKPPYRHDGPNFIPKLKGLQTRITMCIGYELEGTVVAWNRYEILFLVNGKTVPILLMKHGISTIEPLNRNPFEKKEVKNGSS